MISKEFADKQLTRMWGLSFFPKGESDGPSLKELSLALQSAAREDLAESVVSDWLREYSQAPKPADLRRICWEREEAEQRANPRPPEMPKQGRCRICGDRGIVESLPGVYPPLDSIASWCDCEAAETRRSLPFDSRIVESDPRFWPRNINESRAKLMKTWPNWRNKDLVIQLAARKKMPPLRDIYHGEF